MDDLGLFKVGSPLTKKQAAEVFGELSRRYGEGASGEVEAFLNDPRPDGIYMSKERGALQNNPNVSMMRERRVDKGEYTSTDKNGNSIKSYNHCPWDR